MSRGSILQLKITLEGTTPPLWRRFLVRGSTSLSKPHKIVQDVMGWMNYHLYQFEVNGELFEEPYEESRGK